ncbi:MAG: nucleotidyltransferase [Tissierellaceae bacterium]
MKVLGLITEYNPFHYGHKYHLQKSLEVTGASHTIAIMSGSFVQRGEPSLVDKWTKAKMAIANGIDLVIELPFVYSTQSAELFALGGIKVMDSLEIVDYVCFGSESGSLEPLNHIAEILVKEPESYKSKLKGYLDLGMSFPSARSRALIDFLSLKPSIAYDYESILKESNNILAIEYLKSLKVINSNIIPLTIQRQGSAYKDEKIKHTLSSATAIRRSILNKGLGSVKELLPEATYDLLADFYSKYRSFNDLDNYLAVLKYLLLVKEKDSLKSILDMEDGLENRLVEKSFEARGVKDLVQEVSTKRYPKTRIQRILVHLLNQLNGHKIRSLYSQEVPYIRFLAANEKGLDLLSHIKNKSYVPIISKFSHYKDLRNPLVNEFILYEKRATDIYFLPFSTKYKSNNMDYLTSPFIKK